MSSIIRLFITFPRELGLEGLSAQEIIKIMKPDENTLVSDVYNDSPYATVFAEAMMLQERQSKRRVTKKSNQRKRRG